MAEYFGVPPERLREMSGGPRARAMAMGLPFNQPERISNTRRAHLLSEYARAEGKLDALRPALFRAYFAQGRNLFDLDVLKELAEGAGLDPEQASDAILSGRYDERLDRLLAEAGEQEITGVPAFIAGRRYLIVGAYPYEQLREALLRIQAEDIDGA